jgi:hypothetical protein
MASTRETQASQHEPDACVLCVRACARDASSPAHACRTLIVIVSCFTLVTERARKRDLKATKKPDLSQWQDVTDKIWVAYAVDGPGHRTTDGSTNQYDVLVPVADFGDSLLLGGQARFTKVCGGDESATFNLPVEVAQTDTFKFRLHTHGEAAGGLRIMVGGLQVRMPVT